MARVRYKLDIYGHAIIIGTAVLFFILYFAGVPEGLIYFILYLFIFAGVVILLRAPIRKMKSWFIAPLLAVYWFGLIKFDERYGMNSNLKLILALLPPFIIIIIRFYKNLRSN